MAQARSGRSLGRCRGQRCITGASGATDGFVLNFLSQPQNLGLIGIAAGAGAMLLALNLKNRGGSDAVSAQQATQLINHKNAVVVDVRTGRILAAEFINDGRTYSAVWFDDGDGKGGYYTADGKNIRKAFLRSPLEFSRITSGFSSARFHPVLQEIRAHKGIDYGAPTGTRVRATGDGIVESIGRQGGYGNLVVLRHQSQYQTAYGHLSGFASGLRKGSRVSQGDVIGYVGSTGLATGPHLHYEFRVGGVHRNPLTVALPTALPLEANQLARFREQTQAMTQRIDMVRDAQLALLD